MAFDVLVTPEFASLSRKLAKGHKAWPEVCREAVTILAEDPHNRSRRHHIRKLTHVPAGRAQYRLRLGRWRIRYDIEGTNVVLKYCGLRREDTYD